MIAITNQSAPGPLPMLRDPVQISQQLAPIEPAVKTKSGTTIFDTLFGILTGKD
jgi:hypothetical protein